MLLSVTAVSSVVTSNVHNRQLRSLLLSTFTAFTQLPLYWYSLTTTTYEVIGKDITHFYCRLRVWLVNCVWFSAIELNDLWGRYLAWWFTLILSMSSSRVKLRGHKMNVPFTYKAKKWKRYGKSRYAAILAGWLTLTFDMEENKMWIKNAK